MYRVRDLVKGRPIGVLLHGASLKGMETDIHEWGKGDWCWVSLNHFTLVEQGVLDKIGDRLSMVALFSEMMWKRRQDDVMEFLRRGENNLLITSHAILDLVHDRREFIREFREKIYLSEGLPMLWQPNIQRKANSVTLLLNELMAADLGPLYLFGMDGIGPGSSNEEEKASYYHPEQVFWHPHRQTSIGRDTADFNKAFPKVVAYWRKQGYKHDIWNCNPDSYITTFSKRSVASVIQNVLDKGE
jgi:hypothetical protein